MDPATLRKESRQERIRRLVGKYEQELQESLTEGPQTLEQIEAEVSKIGKRVQKDLQEEKLDHLGSGYTQDRLPCTCGSRASYQSEYSRLLLTLHGSLTLRRAYYYCRACKQGSCPLDTILGLDKGETSLGLRGLAARRRGQDSNLRALAGGLFSNGRPPSRTVRQGLHLLVRWSRQRQERGDHHHSCPRGPISTGQSESVRAGRIMVGRTATAHRRFVRLT